MQFFLLFIISSTFLLLNKKNIYINLNNDVCITINMNINVRWIEWQTKVRNYKRRIFFILILPTVLPTYL